jgi:hypothetical protein
MPSGEIDSIFVRFSGEAWFHLSKYTNYQNNRCWSAENLTFIHKMTKMMLGLFDALACVQLELLRNFWYTK